MVPHPDSPSAVRQDGHGVASSVVPNASWRIKPAGLLALPGAEKISFGEIACRCWPATCRHDSRWRAVRQRLPEWETAQEWYPLTSTEPSTRGLASRPPCIDVLQQKPHVPVAAVYTCARSKFGNSSMEVEVMEALQSTQLCGGSNVYNRRPELRS